MNNTNELVVDFVARGASPDEWLMVLVEQDPWSNDVEGELRRLQKRLYDCLDAIFDGKLAKKFPEIVGKDILIRLDCYNLPRTDVASFIDRFSAGIFAGGDYKAELMKKAFVRSVTFKADFDSIH